MVNIIEGKKKKKVLAKEPKTSTKAKPKPTEPKFRTYLVGCCIVGFRQNLMIKAKANNDYCALLAAMKKLRRHVADMYPENSQFIEANWEAEERELCKRFKNYDQLKDYLAVAGFVMTKPFIIDDPHAA